MTWKLVGAGAVVAGLTLAAGAAHAQQDLSAGKTPAQVFSSNCTACHRGPQGLAKGKSAGTISGFLAQHYTTSRGMASNLAGYLASVGGEPPRGTRARPGDTRPPREVPAAGREAPQRQQAQTPERPLSRAELRKQREERKERRRAAEEARLAASGGVVKRPRQPGEPATVSTDPDPVVISQEPGPVFHDRASSRRLDSRDWSTVATAPAAPAPAAPTAAIPAPAEPSATPAVAGSPPSPGATPGAPPAANGAEPPAQAMAAAPGEPLRGAQNGDASGEPGSPSAPSAAPDAPAGGETPGAAAIASQTFSAPLP